MVLVRKQMKIGDKLIKENLITIDQLQQALIEQKNNNSKEKIAEILVRMGFITPEKILPILAEHLGVEYAIINIEDMNEKATELLSEDQMMKHHVFPIKKSGTKLFLAMSDPSNVFVVDEIHLLTRLVVKPVLALSNNIKTAIDHIRNKKEGEVKKEVENILQSANDFVGANDIELVDDIEDISSGLGADSAPIVRTVNAIIAKALEVRASDIHIEPYEKKLRIRLRVDGVLTEIKSFPKNVVGALVSRIKIMSDLDIAEKRLPQDGRFKIKMAGKDIDFRVSCLPTVHGEKIVMRILDKGNLKLNMEDLGFERDDLDKFNKALSSPYGMILVTGPTGSGKSTSLYSALNRVNNPDINISTAEDPVEFQLEGINQVHCRSEIGLDFAAALKSFLRQDPDVIMVGEIRDKETAEISIKAALTGHLVLSTLHTNDAPSTIQRLTNMGIEPFMISASLLLVEAQRLARRVCSKCKEEHTYDPGIFLALGLDVEEYSKKTFYKGRGCEACSGTGYKGRLGIYEIMLIDDDLRQLIAQGVNSDIIRKKAVQNGMYTLRQRALQKAEQGQTTLEEVLRVTIE